ncbi:MAG: LysM peptidoglycan-binding domain-containing protein, partial [candidate division KSB1 bacterium]
TVYPTTSMVIHDMEDMSVIYEAVDFSKGSDVYLTYRQQVQKANQVKDEYATLIRSWARGTLDTTASNPRVQRLLEIYGSNPDPARLTRASENMRTQLGIQDRFRQGLQRSGLYRDAISLIFAQEGLPLELIMLPHVESSFNYKAYSKVGAAGMWQFMRSTGRLFMTISYDVDERLDPIRSTEAAAKLLKMNYAELGSWPLAITAYNHGLSSMKRARSLYGHDFDKMYREYRHRAFGFASKNFYAQFLAALEVANNHIKYFGPLEFHQPEAFVEMPLEHYVTVNRILETFELSLEYFSDLNPGLRPPVMQSQRRIPKGYMLRLPQTAGVDQYTLAARLGQGSQFAKQVDSDWYRVERGDNLAAIAARHSTTVKALAEYNSLRSTHRIDAGMVLKIPPSTTKMMASATPATTKPGAVTSSDAGATIPLITPETIRPEPSRPTPTEEEIIAAMETESEPSSEPELEVEPVVVVVTAEPEIPREEREAVVTYEPTPEPVKAAPSVATKAATAESTVPTPARTPRKTSAAEWIMVQPEETLGHYATWLEVSTRRLRELNGLRQNREIHIGQRIRVSYDRISAEVFEKLRNEFQRSIQEDFFATYQVDTLQTYRIKRGQNIWQICNNVFEVPMWLVAKYNPERDLTKLKPGDELAIPVVVAINPAAAPSVQQ